MNANTRKRGREGESVSPPPSSRPASAPSSSRLRLRPMTGSTNTLHSRSLLSRKPQFGGARVVGSATASARSSGASRSSSSTGSMGGKNRDPSPRLLALEAKCTLQEHALQHTSETLRTVRLQLEETMDAAEAMVVSYDQQVAQVQKSMQSQEAAHLQAMKSLQTREQRCIAKKNRCLEEEQNMRSRVENIQKEKEVMLELIALQRGKVAQKESELTQVKERTEEMRAELQQLEAETHLMEDDSYGLSGEVKEVVVATKQVEKEIQAVVEESMKLEITRRELFSTAEALNGSIRVYGRVRGRQLPHPIACTSGRPSMDSRASDDVSPLPGSPTSPSTHAPVPSCTAVAELEDSQLPSAPPSQMDSSRASLASSSGETGPTGSRRCSTSNAKGQTGPSSSSAASGPLRSAPMSRSASSRSVGQRPGAASRSLASGAAHGGLSAGPTMRKPLAKLSRLGPTSGALVDDDGTELFSFAPSPHDEALARMSKAVDEEHEQEQRSSSSSSIPNRVITVHQKRHNATSTGTNAITESFTFDRIFDADPALHGITPRSMNTIFRRAKELAEEGWRYEFRCSVIEIYNDTIRDLLQPASLYESGGAAFQQPNYHSIQHHPEDQSTTVTHVREHKIHDHEEFQRVYQQAIRHRRTASTSLNARSSRSHCICLLHLDGVNDTIRQRSRGKLCLVDLAGSERVNDSGVKGQQLREAININKSLLDLGKCISALRTSAVFYLGAKGGKMLMLVTVSDKKEHVAETVNALRFAARVSETIVGPSVKRVLNY
eukprot:gene8245-5766_t